MNSGEWRKAETLAMTITWLRHKEFARSDALSRAFGVEELHPMPTTMAEQTPAPAVVDVDDPCEQCTGTDLKASRR